MFSPSLAQEGLDDVTVNVGQSEWTTGVGKRQAFMIDPEKVKDRRLDVVDMNRTFDGVESKFIRPSERLTGADSTSRHPHRKGLRMVVTPQLSTQRSARLDHGCSSEFAAPYNQGVFQHATLLEILDQGGTRLIRLFALVLDAVFHVAVVIPARVIELNKANAPLRQPSCE